MSPTSPTPPARPGRPSGEAWIRVDDRLPADRGRASPRIRLDPLQLAAWAEGLALVIAGLIALARVGFDELALFEPVVEVAGLPATPLLALLLVLTGALLLTLSTGEVDDRSLRLGGVVLAIVGVVWAVEPGSFAPYLGIEAANGTAALLLGLALSLASFLPPLSIRRPGTRPRA